ncbi:MAG: carbamate kinase [Caldimonas sp.]
MRIVVALGGNALLRRGEPMSAANQLANVKRAAAQIALIAPGNELVLTHGNGPQVGLIALQVQAYAAGGDYPLDVLGAESEGMVGYLLEQELGNLLPGLTVVTLLTRTEVDRDDPAFSAPSKPIGLLYGKAKSERIAQSMGWTMAADGTGFRRVVASPKPLRVLSLQPIQWLLAQRAVVIAAGGGGIPVASTDGGPRLQGVEAVIDKDASSSLLARQLSADCLLIATDVDAVYVDFGKTTQRAVRGAAPSAFARSSFASGSMAPKVAAACAFVDATGKRAAIGSLESIEAMLHGDAGTQITHDGANAL